LAGQGIEGYLNPPFLARQRLTGVTANVSLRSKVSGRMSGIKFRRRLFPALGDHFCWIRLSRHSPRSELFSLDVILGLPWQSVVNLPANLDALVVNLPTRLPFRCHLLDPLLEKLDAGKSPRARFSIHGQAIRFSKASQDHNQDHSTKRHVGRG
jgi:hypothetical protein